MTYELCDLRQYMTTLLWSIQRCCTILCTRRLRAYVMRDESFSHFYSLNNYHCLLFSEGRPPDTLCVCVCVCV